MGKKCAQSKKCTVECIEAFNANRYILDRGRSRVDILVYRIFSLFI